MIGNQAQEPAAADPPAISLLGAEGLLYRGQAATHACTHAHAGLALQSPSTVIGCWGDIRGPYRQPAGERASLLLSSALHLYQHSELNSLRGTMASCMFLPH